MSIWRDNARIPDFEAQGLFFDLAGLGNRYPMYMYLGPSDQDADEMEARGSKGVVLVNDTSEELAARAKGYDNIHAGMIQNKVLINWYWDLEDFSPKQLSIFAKEEFEVDLPKEADQTVLLDAVLKLTKAAPQNCNRIVLMAHTIQMNYDETLSTIRKMAENASEVETKEYVI